MDVQVIFYDSTEYWAAVRLREIVLRLPLFLRFSCEELLRESEELMICLFADDQKMVATNQFVIAENSAKMRQVATGKSYQGKGFGRRLYLESEEILKAKGIREIHCHARLSARAFYLKMGFEVYSEEFLEVSIPHVKMRKVLH